MTQENKKGIVVAKVNAEELYEVQLENAVKEYSDSLKEQGINIKAYGQDQLHNIRKFMLQKMVERELIHQEAVKKKIKITSKEIDQVMDKTEEHYDSHQAFIDDILKNYTTLESYRERLAYDMMVNTMAAERYEQRKKVLPQKEIRKFYQDNRQRFAQPESVKIGHILKKIPEDADQDWDNAKKNLRTLRKSTEDFRLLAKKHSQCASAKQGGDLGFYSIGQLYPPLENAAFKLKINEISKPVESREGVHLIKLYERRSQGFIPDFEEIKDQVETVAKTDQAQSIYLEYVEGLKKKARIHVFEN
jgi:parvulin-like peptidyl-prolyl isomerase